MNVTTFKIGYVDPFALFKTSPSPISELQNAIVKSDLVALERLASTHSSLLSQKMPNGELPLNFAVQQRNELVVKKMLELNSDPSLKDDQHLNAIDYATLIGEEKIIAQILHHYISEDLQDIQSCLQNPTVKKEMATAVKQIYNSINYLAIEKMTSLQRAILQKDKEKVKVLLDDKEQVSHLTCNGSSILHLAAAAGDKEIFSMCLPHLKIKEVVDLKDNQGFTPLHYAASQGHLGIMQMLTKEGANIRLTDDRHLTPLMLLWENIELRDPLRIDLVDQFVFLASLAMWASQFITLETVDWRIAIALHMTILSWNFLAVGIRNLQIEVLQTRKEMIFKLVLSAIVGGIVESTFRTNNLARLVIWAYTASGFAKRAFNGLNNCWRNSNRGRGRALLKGFISHGPEVKVAFDLSSLIFGKLPPMVANVYNLYHQMSTCKTIHPFTCLSRLSEMSQFCAQDKESAACQEASYAYAKFIKRTGWLENIFKACESVLPSLKENCDKAASNYRSICYRNPESSACDEAEDLLKKTITFLPPEQCQNAIEKLTGNANSTFVQVKKAFQRIALNAHPDKSGTSEKFIDYQDVYEIAKKCLMQS